MVKIAFSAQALRDLERLFEFAAVDDLERGLRAIAHIRNAVSILNEHPGMGRPIAGGLHELVISYGSTGYLALYRWLPARSLVRILAFRLQREFRYRGER